MAKKKRHEKPNNAEAQAQVEEQGLPVNGEDPAREGSSLDEELKKAKDKHLRLFAEFENYKKRTARERIELIGRSTEELMTALLPVLDDFDRAIRSINEAKEVGGLIEGVELIYNKLKKTLEQKGLQEMGSAVGQELDTDYHEAITEIPAPEDSLKGKVVDEVEKGYLLNDRVIRYAKVGRRANK